ncbi:MAG: hypothetical protein V3V49_15315 [Candidatus Krumholzibacteria bacterium]
MKRGLLLATAMLLGASLTFGQAGAIGTYADPLGLDCNVTGSIGSVLSIFVVHTLTPGATASRFRASAPLCMLTTGSVHLSDTVVFPVTVGSSQTGVAIGYGACLAGPIHVLTINYMSGATPFCCEYTVQADPGSVSGQIEVDLCSGQLAFGVGLTHTVNGTIACPCSVPVPVEAMSWGRVKAMYVE